MLAYYGHKREPEVRGSVIHPTPPPPHWGGDKANPARLLKHREWISGSSGEETVSEPRAKLTGQITCCVCLIKAS